MSKRGPAPQGTGVRQGRFLIIDGVIYRASRTGPPYDRWQAAVLDRAGAYAMDERVPPGDFATMRECHAAIRSLHEQTMQTAPWWEQERQAWAAQCRTVAGALREARAWCNDDKLLDRIDNALELLDAMERGVRA